MNTWLSALPLPPQISVQKREEEVVRYAKESSTAPGDINLLGLSAFSHDPQMATTRTP